MKKEEEEETDIRTWERNSRKSRQFEKACESTRDLSCLKWRFRDTNMKEEDWEQNEHRKKKEKNRKGMINTKDSWISETRNSQKKARLNG